MDHPFFHLLVVLFPVIPLPEVRSPNQHVWSVVRLTSTPTTVLPVPGPDISSGGRLDYPASVTIYQRPLAVVISLAICALVLPFQIFQNGASPAMTIYPPCLAVQKPHREMLSSWRHLITGHLVANKPPPMWDDYIELQSGQGMLRDPPSICTSQVLFYRLFR